MTAFRSSARGVLLSVFRVPAAAASRFAARFRADPPPYLLAAAVLLTIGVGSVAIAWPPLRPVVVLPPLLVVWALPEGRSEPLYHAGCAASLAPGLLFLTLVPGALAFTGSATLWIVGAAFTIHLAAVLLLGFAWFVRYRARFVGRVTRSSGLVIDTYEAGGTRGRLRDDQLLR